MNDKQESADRNAGKPVAFITVHPLRLAIPGPSRPREAEGVAVESLLSIDVQDVGTFSLMCTPEQTRALCAGFLFTEGLIASRDDILMLSDCQDDTSVIRVRLAKLAPDLPVDTPRTVVSSCGMCGTGRKLDQLLAEMSPVGNCLRIPASLLPQLMHRLRDRQALFVQTGGTHAAGLFSADGDLLAHAEDVGRHNALDKAIGTCVLTGRPLAGCLVALSGRVSLEMVTKSARAGLEIICAVSAPTSLAIEAATRAGITLCGFVRERRATIYTCPERIDESMEPIPCAE